MVSFYPNKQGTLMRIDQYYNQLSALDKKLILDTMKLNPQVVAEQVTKDFKDFDSVSQLDIEYAINLLLDEGLL